MTTLTDDLQGWFDRSRERRQDAGDEPRLERSAGSSRSATASPRDGLPGTRLDELLVFDGGVRGLAVDLGEEPIGCVLLGGGTGIAPAALVRGTGEVARVPVGDGAARPGRRRARHAAGRRRAAAAAELLAGGAARARDRRPGARHAPARDRAAGRRRDDSARPGPARADHRRSRDRARRRSPSTPSSTSARAT